MSPYVAFAYTLITSTPSTVVSSAVPSLSYQDRLYLCPSRLMVESDICVPFLTYLMRGTHLQSELSVQPCSQWWLGASTTNMNVSRRSVNGVRPVKR